MTVSAIFLDSPSAGMQVEASIIVCLFVSCILEVFAFYPVRLLLRAVDLFGGVIYSESHFTGFQPKKESFSR